LVFNFSKSYGNLLDRIDKKDEEAKKMYWRTKLADGIRETEEVTMDLGAK